MRTATIENLDTVVNPFRLVLSSRKLKTQSLRNNLVRLHQLGETKLNLLTLLNTQMFQGVSGVVLTLF